MSLTITKIAAENILKFEQFELDNPSKLTLYRGANNQGKTSALKLLSLCVKGTDNPKSVIHDGAAKGNVSLGLSNGYTMRRSFTEKGTYFKLYDERGHEVPKPQEQIDRLLGEYRDFNPLAWLSMTAKDQIRVLLQAIDVRLTEAEFKAATGFEAPIGVDFEQHGLLVIDALAGHYLEERKIENRTADQKKKAAAEARAQLPAEKPVISQERREKASATLSEARSAMTQIEARRMASKQYASAVQLHRDAIKHDEDAIRELDAENNRLRAVIAKNEERQQKLRSSQVAHEEEITKLATSAPPTAEEANAVQGQLSQAEAAIAGIAADERILRRFTDVENIEFEAVNATARASILGETIDAIRGTLRKQLLEKAKLPVKSLAIEDERIYIDGFELQHLAESQQIRVALSIARSLNPELKAIVLDGTERLDSETFAHFLDEIRGDGFSYFASEVDRNGGPLEIIRFGETETAVVEEVA